MDAKRKLQTQVLLYYLCVEYVGCVCMCVCDLCGKGSTCVFMWCVCDLHVGYICVMYMWIVHVCVFMLYFLMMSVYYLV